MCQCPGNTRLEGLRAAYNWPEGSGGSSSQNLQPHTVTPSQSSGCLPVPCPGRHIEVARPKRGEGRADRRGPTEERRRLRNGTTRRPPARQRLRSPAAARCPSAGLPGPRPESLAGAGPAEPHPLAGGEQDPPASTPPVPAMEPRMKWKVPAGHGVIFGCFRALRAGKLEADFRSSSGRGNGMVWSQEEAWEAGCARSCRTQGTYLRQDLSWGGAGNRARLKVYMFQPSGRRRQAFRSCGWNRNA